MKFQNRDPMSGRRRRKAKPTASVGTRGPPSHASSELNRFHRERLGNKAYSRNAQRVLKQATHAESDGTAIVQPGFMWYHHTDGQLLTSRIRSPASGIVDRSKQRITVTVGTSGIGFMLIRWDLTGPSQQSFAVGTSQILPTNVCDVLYTTGAYAGSNINFGTLNMSVGLAGVAGMCSTVNTMQTFSNMNNGVTGERSWACLGQTITLDANRSAVMDRSGSISVVHIKSVLPTTVDQGVLDANPRAMVYDAADLTEENQFITSRPTDALGRFITPAGGAAGNVYGFGNIAGALTSADGYEAAKRAGFTLIYVSSAANDQFVFEVDTLIAWGGTKIPMQVDFCPDPEAYSVVRCGRTQASEGTNSATVENRSERGRRIHRTMMKAAESFVPNYITDSLMNVGGKLLDNVLKLVI